MNFAISTGARLAELPRYTVISVVALSVDMTVLMLMALLVHYLWAATMGFVAGAVTSYVLAVRWAFRHRRLARRPGREFVAYALVGLAGLALNNLVIALAASTAALPLAGAKVLAAGATFVFNYGVRKRVLFSGTPS